MGVAEGEKKREIAPGSAGVVNGGERVKGGGGELDKAARKSRRRVRGDHISGSAYEVRSHFPVTLP